MREDRLEYDLPQPHFKTTFKSLLTKEDITSKLQFLKKIDRMLGARRDAWCKFHQARGHETEKCLTLKYQLTKLVKEGFLAKYIQDLEINRKGEDQSRERNHETLILGDFNIIVGGFSGGCSSSSGRKCYLRSVLSLETREPPTFPPLCFSSTDLEDVYLH